MLTEVSEFIVKFFVGIFSASANSRDYPKTIQFMKGIIIAIAGIIIGTIKHFSSGGAWQNDYLWLFLCFLLILIGGAILGLFFILVNYPYDKK